ncbi:MAG: lipopolysaccharide biosynthesis protein [Gaiellaceae bacterium]
MARTPRGLSVARGVFLTVIARYGRVASALGTAVITARALGPSDRGLYFFILTIATLLAHLGHLGLYSTNIYQVAKSPQLAGTLASNSLWVSVVVGGLGGLCVVALLDATGSFVVPAITYWAAPALAIALLYWLLIAPILLGLERFQPYSIIEIGTSVLLLAAVAVAALIDPTLGGLLFATASASLAATLLILRFVQTRLGRGFGFGRQAFRAGLAFSAKAYLLSVLGFFVLRSGVFLLLEFSGPDDVGYFSVAVQIHDALILLPASVALVFFPRLVTDVAGRWSVTLRLLGVVAVTTTIVAMVVAVVAGPAVRLAFGEDFEPAVPVVRWILPGVVAASLCSVLSSYLTAIGIPWQVLASWLLAVGTAAVASVVLIREEGAEGAAAAMSISYSVLLVCLLGTAFRYRGFAEHPGSGTVHAQAVGGGEQ